MLEQLAERNLALALNASRTARTFGLNADVFAAYMLGQLDAADATLGLESIARMAKPANQAAFRVEPQSELAADPEEATASVDDSMSIDTVNLEALLGDGPNFRGQVSLNRR